MSYQYQPQVVYQQPQVMPVAYQAQPQMMQPQVMYQAQPQMVVAQGGGGNRNARGLHMGPHGREWSHSLCGCCGDCGFCCLTFVCPCIAYGRVRNRLKHLQYRGMPDPERGGICSGECWLYGLTGFLGVACILQMMNRGEVRGRYHIEGGGCGDCCAALCCGPCELVQDSQEIELEEQSFGHMHYKR